MRPLYTGDIVIISGDKLITMRGNLRYNHNMAAHKIQ